MNGCLRQTGLLHKSLTCYSICMWASPGVVTSWDLPFLSYLLGWSNLDIQHGDVGYSCLPCSSSSTTFHQHSKEAICGDCCPHWCPAAVLWSMHCRLPVLPPPQIKAEFTRQLLQEWTRKWSQQVHRGSALGLSHSSSFWFVLSATYSMTA